MIKYGLFHLFLKPHLLTTLPLTTFSPRIHIQTPLPVYNIKELSTNFHHNPLNFITLHACLQSHFWAGSVDRNFLPLRTSSLVETFQTRDRSWQWYTNDGALYLLK